MILRARVVVTMDGPPIANGAVAIDHGRIVDVGEFEEIKARNSGETVDLGDRALLPGLINAHCHLDYTCLRGKIPRTKSFTDWIRAINAQKAKLSPQDYVASIDAGFAEARKFGTTAMANLTAFPELIGQVRATVRTWWFAELIDVRGKVDVDLVVPLLDQAKCWGLAPHTPFTASADVYRRSQEIAPLVTTHLAESREEMSMFRDATGPLYEFSREIGRDMGDCGEATPLDTFLGRLGDASLPWILTHMNELTDSDFDLLKKSASKFSIVHCPRSHEYFEHSPFRFEQLRALGMNICLGTDSLASNDDLSLFAEMRGFQDRFPAVSTEEVVSMVTLNPARALKQENLLGQIRSGAMADFIAVPSDDKCNVFDQIVAFEGEPFVMTKGRE